MAKQLDFVGMTFKKAEQYLTKTGFSYIVRETGVSNLSSLENHEQYVIKQNIDEKETYNLLLCYKKGGVNNGL